MKWLLSTASHKNLLLSLAALLLVCTFSFGGPLNTSFFGDLALHGYDPVAYHTEGKPVEGSKEFTAEHGGGTYRFSSASNRDVFAANPDKYLPAYGGYCAWAMAEGKKADVNPKNWKIVAGKLYLNFNSDVQEKWEADVPGFITKANARYRGL